MGEVLGVAVTKSAAKQQRGAVREGNWHTYVKADIVVEEASASVDHFDVVELVLAHCLKYRDLHRDTPKVEFGSFIWIHAVELCCLSVPPALLVVGVYARYSHPGSGS